MRITSIFTAAFALANAFTATTAQPHTTASAVAPQITMPPHTSGVDHRVVHMTLRPTQYNSTTSYPMMSVPSNGTTSHPKTCKCPTCMGGSNNGSMSHGHHNMSMPMSKHCTKKHNMTTPMPTSCPKGCTCSHCRQTSRHNGTMLHGNTTHPGHGNMTLPGSHPKGCSCAHCAGRHNGTMLHGNMTNKCTKPAHPKGCSCSRCTKPAHPKGCSCSRCKSNATATLPYTNPSPSPSLYDRRHIATLSRRTDSSDHSQKHIAIALGLAAGGFFLVTIFTLVFLWVKRRRTAQKGKARAELEMEAVNTGKGLPPAPEVLSPDGKPKEFAEHRRGNGADGDLGAAGMPKGWGVGGLMAV